MIVGEHQGQSEVVIDPISPKSWSLSQMKHASPGTMNVDVSLLKSSSDRRLTGTLAIGIFLGRYKFWHGLEIRHSKVLEKTGR